MSEAPSEQGSLSAREKRELLARLLKERARRETRGNRRAAEPPLVASPQDRFEPFPLRDIQQAYWVGRSPDFELGNVGSRVYFEFDSPRVDPRSLGLALDALVRRHEMLRAVVLPTGQQRILPEAPPFPVTVVDLAGESSGTLAPRLEAIRRELSHRVVSVEEWPLFDVQLTLLPDAKVRIHFGIDLLIADLRSIFILLGEWFQLYVDPTTALPPLDVSFRDYVLAERTIPGTEAFARAESYWRRRIPRLPPAPDLPLAKPPASVGHPRFTRRRGRLTPASWERLRRLAEERHVTAASVLLTAFGRTLSCWSRSPKFTINVTVFNRLPLHPRVGLLIGDFTSVILADFDFSVEEPFARRTERVHEQLWEALDHREFSGIRILRELMRRADSPTSAVMPVVFTCDLRHDIASIQETHRDVLPGEIAYGVSQTPQVYLDHQVFEDRGGLTIHWDAVEELFPAGVLQDMFDANLRFLERLGTDDAAWSELERSLPPEHHREIVDEANRTGGPVSDELLQGLFAKQALHAPDCVAIAAPGRAMTYGELSRRAEGLGRRLRDLGVIPNSLVAVVMEKGWEQVAAVMGILHSGGAYLPIDPELPRERLHYLLDHGRVEVALTQSRLDERLDWPPGVRCVLVDLEEPAPAGEASLAPVQAPSDLAYVIYTSGSTGLPKGVMIDHRGAVNTILDVNERFQVGPEDRVLALSSLSFDLSVYDVFGILAAGGTIVMPDPEAARDPAHWAERMLTERVTIWNSVPAMMEMWVEYAAARPAATGGPFRLALLSGDWIPVTLPARLRELAREVEVVSLGGATEASIWSILHRIDEVPAEWTSIPYGRPMRNQRFYVLDGAMELRPLHVPGELYIGGVGVAKGYWRDDERTEERFVVHPRTGERLYRTGDLGRYLPDGSIEFLGREDFQVKIQGYRVELGEIEAALGQHPGIRSAAVCAEGGERGPKHLVGHVVAADGSPISEGALKRFLADKLPRYMVPSRIVLRDALPLTSNGKVDRKALVAPAPAPSAPRESANHLTQRLQNLVARALGLDAVDADANLLELGASSLDMVRVANLLERELGSRPTMQEFFRSPTIAGLARHYGQPSIQVLDAAASPGRRPESQWESFATIADTGEREAFKRREPGLRPLGSEPVVELPSPGTEEAQERALAERRSHRRFLDRPLSLEAFGALLCCLRQGSIQGKPKRRYASAGGLYPVQAYLHVEADRIEGLTGGIYYYHPRDHRLVALSPEACLDRSIHWPANREIFDGAAFSIFLVAQIGAIAPLYQEKSFHFSTIEAGAMSHLLECSAAPLGIGLCQIGDLDFESVRDWFVLDEGHVLVHSLLGGPVDVGAVAESPGEDPTLAAAAPPPLPTVDAARVDELASRAVLAAEIRAGELACEPVDAPARALLTGATGFLGAFLLRALLDRTRADIFCLVRAESDDEARGRLRRNLELYSLWDDRVETRVHPVPGDLSRPGLGLVSRELDRMAKEIDVIYHNGARVNLVESYADLEATNVGGTRGILALATRERLKPVHFVSSVAVFPFDSGEERREEDALEHGEVLLGGYAQSKWVAEKLVVLARSRGVPVAVYRPGTITGHSGSGVFSRDSYLSNWVKGCVELGSVPELDVALDMVPVDFVSEAIVRLSLRQESIGRTFHLTNPRPFPLAELIEWMRALGYPLRRLDYESWVGALFASPERLESNALYPFAALLARSPGPSGGPRYDCSNTLRALEGSSVVCPPVDEGLLSTYFARFVETGFLPKSPRMTRGAP